MLVILCHPDDTSAVWLHRELSAAGVSAMLVSVEQLVFSRSITHALSGTADTGTIRLADGRVLHPEAITGLINRVQFVPTQHFSNAATGDREYATAELHAFLLAWLNGIAGRVLNPPRPMLLGGGLNDLAAIRHYAATAGLPTAPWRQSTRRAGRVSTAETAARPTHVVSVLDGRVFGPIIPGELLSGCCRLAAYLGTPLMQVAFSRSASGVCWFLHATPKVDFERGGRPLVSAIARAVVT